MHALQRTGSSRVTAARKDFSESVVRVHRLRRRIKRQRSLFVSGEKKRIHAKNAKGQQFFFFSPCTTLAECFRRAKQKQKLTDF
jgi:hypothetical protein